MQSLLQNEPKDKKRRLSGKAITFILIAAIIMAVATTVFAIPSCREFILKQYSSYSEYYVPDAKNSRVETLKVNYVPDGFEKTANMKNTLFIVITMWITAKNILKFIKLY